MVNIYQLFPRLFGNKVVSSRINGTIHTNGCGKFDDISDVALLAIKEMGITHIWLTGILRHATLTDYSAHGIPKSHPSVVKGLAGSPYAINDYYDVDPDLSVDVSQRMREFEALIGRIHNHGMKVLMDFVPNHLAREYASVGKPTTASDFGFNDQVQLAFHPNNNFYYIQNQSFWPPYRESDLYQNDKVYIEQPAKATGNDCFNAMPTLNDWFETVKLNYGIDYQNDQQTHFDPVPDTWFKMEDILKFWLKKGVDGFRVDVMWHMIKDLQLRNNPVAPNSVFNAEDLIYDHYLPVFSTDQPEVHDIVRRMRNVTNEYHDRVLIGEIYLPVDKLVAYYGKDNSGAHLPFNFQLLTMPWDAVQIATAIDQYEGALPQGGWPNWVLGNHDQPRISSRVGRSQAKVAALLLLTLRGTPTIYYGDEIGMRDVPIPLNEIVDPQGLRMPDRNISRDPSRTPMQWDTTTFAGFSTRTPWLRLPENFRRVNVETQTSDSYSMLSFYRRIINLRREEPALHSGRYIPVYSDKQMIAYKREWNGTKFLILLNLSHRPCYFKSVNKLQGEIIISTELEREGSVVETPVTLSGDEGVVIRLTDERPD